MQRTRNSENRKARQLGHSNIEGTFQLSTANTINILLQRLQSRDNCRNNQRTGPWTQLTACVRRIRWVLGSRSSARNNLGDLGNDLGRQLRTQDPGENITADAMLPGTKMIDRCGLRKRALLDGYEDYCRDRIHIPVRARVVNVDQVASVE